jgi:hypothetical protein
MKWEDVKCPFVRRRLCMHTASIGFQMTLFCSWPLTSGHLPGPVHPFSRLAFSLGTVVSPLSPAQTGAGPKPRFLPQTALTATFLSTVDWATVPTVKMDRLTCADLLTRGPCVIPRRKKKIHLKQGECCPRKDREKKKTLTFPN